METNKIQHIVIAHHGLDRKITQEECFSVLTDEEKQGSFFVDFEVGNARLSELYDLSFENIALLQQRKFNDVVKPLMDDYPDARIIYFGYVPIPISFHLGYLVGNTREYTIYQLHHQKNKWYKEAVKPSEDYEFSIKPITYPLEKQKGKGDVVVRVATSYAIDEQATYQLVQNPENEFDISLEKPHVDSLYSQENIREVLRSFQEILHSYANELCDRERIHLFIASSCGLPFALGTIVNINVCSYIQTYQFSRSESPKYREAVLIVKEEEDRVVLSESDRLVAKEIRIKWQEQLESTIKPFIDTVSGKKTDNWLQMLCTSDHEYNTVQEHLCHPWNKVTDINKTSLKHDSIDLETTDVDDGFKYVQKSNKWLLDDGFLFGLRSRFDKNEDTDIMQASRLFFFHESLHYSHDGHRLTRETAAGIGQFPKVIEEADYQADVWALLTEYKYCSIYNSKKLKNGLKTFFCDAIETAIETMWSFVDTGEELKLIQIRSMNRFLNWYWQLVLIEKVEGTGTLEEVIRILLDKPIIEFAGAQMELRGYKTYFKLNPDHYQNYQLAAFANNRVYRFTPNLIYDIVDGFRVRNGEGVKAGLRSFHAPIS